MIPQILYGLGITILIVWAADCFADARAQFLSLPESPQDKLSDSERGARVFNHHGKGI